MVTGIVTSAGAAVRVGAAIVALPASTTPVRDYIEQLCAAGEILPCPHCGTWYGCDCVDWLEWMAAANNNADPHGDLSWRDDEELPY